MEYILVDNEPKYYEFIRQMRIHPENISGFINQNHITEDEQIEYMKHYHQYFKICLFENSPVGFVGVIDDDIRVATNPDFKQKGAGKFMIDEIMKLYPNAHAKVKIDNISSMNLFLSCGFKTEMITMKKCQ